MIRRLDLLVPGHFPEEVPKGPNPFNVDSTHNFALDDLPVFDLGRRSFCVKPLLTQPPEPPDATFLRWLRNQGDQDGTHL
jgi:hypothetical protein